MSHDYNRDQHLQSQPGGYGTASPSPSTHSGSRDRSDSCNSRPRARESFPNDAPTYRSNEGRELFPGRGADLQASTTRRDNHEQYRSPYGAADDGVTRGNARHGPSGAYAIPVARRVEDLRSGGQTGHANRQPRTDYLRDVGTGLQRSGSAAGQKRSSSSEDDRASKSSRTERKANLTRPRKGDPGDPFRVTRDNCKPGTIIQGLLYEEAMDESLVNRARNGGNNSAITGLFKLGLDGEDDWWIHKNRPCIITAVYADSYTCIPMYTCNGEGLAKKMGIPGLVEEFVRVKEHTPDVMSLASDDPSSQMDLYVDTLYEDFELHAESAAWLTYTMSRRFAGRANVVGKLRHSSVQVLMRHLRHYAPHRQPFVEITWRPTDRPSNPEVHGHDRLSETVTDAY